MEGIKIVALGFILTIQSILDIKTKRLPLWITGMGMVIGILFWFLEADFHLTNITAMIPGIICLVIAKVSREAIGYGDGLLLVMIGFYLKFPKVLGLCMWAFTIAGIVALFLLVTKKKKGKQEIPFVPFLCLGFLLEVILC